MSKFEVLKDLILFCGAWFGTQGAWFNLIGCFVAVVLSTIRLVGSNRGLVKEGIFPKRSELPT